MPFIMELPLYHKPNPRTIVIVVWNRIIAFVKRAGTVILVASVVVWLLSNVARGRIEDGQILARIGRLMQPIGGPMGLGWKEMVALVSSLVAKENSVATLGVLYGVGEEGLRQALPHAMGQSFSPRISRRSDAVSSLRSHGCRDEAGDGKLEVVHLVLSLHDNRIIYGRSGGIPLRAGVPDAVRIGRPRGYKRGLI